MEGWSKGSVAAALFGIWATFALDVYSTLNSSPQTTELFAKDRQDSLMHWVYIGDGVAAIGGVLAAWKSKNIWPAIGAIGVMLMMHWFYNHAVARGIDKAAPSSGTPTRSFNLGIRDF